jgi:hypothetical protein
MKDKQYTGKMVVQAIQLLPEKTIWGLPLRSTPRLRWQGGE